MQMDYTSAYTDISNILITYNKYMFEYTDNEGSNCDIVVDAFNVLLLLSGKRTCVSIIPYSCCSNNVYAQEEISTLVLQCSRDLLNLIHNKYNLTQIECTTKEDIIHLYKEDIKEYSDKVDFPFSKQVRLPVIEAEGCVSYIL